MDGGWRDGLTLSAPVAMDREEEDAFRGEVGAVAQESEDLEEYHRQLSCQAPVEMAQVGLHAR